MSHALRDPIREARRAARLDGAAYFCAVMAARGETWQAMASLHLKAVRAAAYMTDAEFAEYRATLAESDLRLPEPEPEMSGGYTECAPCDGNGCDRCMPHLFDEESGDE